MGDIQKEGRCPAIAIIGGGIAGTSAACRLSTVYPSAKVTVFDWGRRPGGRAAHRTLWVNREGKERFDTPPKEEAEKWWRLRFDHGCQFFEARDERFLSLLAPPLKAGVIKAWPGQQQQSRKREHEGEDQKGGGQENEGAPVGWLLKDGTFVPRGPLLKSRSSLVPTLSANSSSPPSPLLKDGFFGLCGGLPLSPLAAAPAASSSSSPHDEKEQGRTYVAVGGMTELCAWLQQQIVASFSSSSSSAAQCRIAQFRRVADIRKMTLRSALEQQRGRTCWRLFGDRMHHETAVVEDGSGSSIGALGDFDAVIITEHMAWLPDWHPCSLPGLHRECPKSLQWVRKELGYDRRTRRFRHIAPLFTLMIAFEKPFGGGGGGGGGGGDGAGDSTDDGDKDSWGHFAAACIEGSPVLQLVSRQRSRPLIRGESERPSDRCPEAECWVLVSTEAFANRCLDSEQMSKKKKSNNNNNNNANNSSKPRKRKREGEGGGEEGETKKMETGGGEEEDAPSRDVQYVPQEESYLRGDPANIMTDAFLDVMAKYHRQMQKSPEAKTVMTASGSDDAAPFVPPQILYRRCQRWGAAYALPREMARGKSNGGDLHNHADGEGTFGRGHDSASIVNHGLCWQVGQEAVFCAGDYVCPPSPSETRHRRPFESAALSGITAADALHQLMTRRQR